MKSVGETHYDGLFQRDPRGIWTNRPLHKPRLSGGVLILGLRQSFFLGSLLTYLSVAFIFGLRVLGCRSLSVFTWTLSLHVSGPSFDLGNVTLPRLVHGSSPPPPRPPGGVRKKGNESEWSNNKVFVTTFIQLFRFTEGPSFSGRALTETHRRM